MLTINNENWTIQIVPADHPMLLTSSGKYTIGACDDNYKTIYISEGLSRHKLRKVLCHEITHAAMFSYNIDLAIEQEELIADLMATFGWQIISETCRIYDDIV